MVEYSVDRLSTTHYCSLRTESLDGAEAWLTHYRQCDEDGAIYHTYSAHARRLDMLNTAYHHLDLTPKGRDEVGLPWPMAWLRRHDQYEN